ncbi:12240_t:CDS:1, partial [Entrophospora sp. SA101]
MADTPAKRWEPKVKINTHEDHTNFEYGLNVPLEYYDQNLSTNVTTHYSPT